jgi:hypothetical protein
MVRTRALSLQSFLISNTKEITVIGSIILTFIIIDMLFSFAASTISVSANWEIALFLIIAAVYGITQYAILNFIKNITKKIRASVPLIRTLHLFVSLTQYVLLAFIIIVILEILISSQYNTAILNWGTAINYAISGSVWAVLAARLLAWYRSTKSFIVLMYALSSVITGISFLLWLPYNAGVLLDMPTHRDIHTPPTSYQFYPLHSTMGILQYDSGVVIFVNVALLWLSSVLILYPFSNTIGKTKFWVLMTIPLIISVMVPTGLLFAYIPSILGIASSNIPLYLTVLYTLVPGIVAGFLFGAPFFIIAKRIPSNALKEYLIITAWGLIIFNVTTSGNVLNAAYPPFGFSNVMFQVTACYLIFVGLYSSAISISGDTKLRQTIKRSLLDESKLLDSLGSAQMKQETMSRISKIVEEQKQSLTEQTGVQSSTDETEIKQYLEEVIKEVQQQKQKHET